ncbi:MAG: hypothetical protein ACXAEU_01000 [Candidatus Hodarchaeales archaeon]
MYRKHAYKKLHGRLLILSWLIPSLLFLLCIDNFIFFVNFILTAGDPTKNLWGFSLTTNYSDMGFTTLFLTIFLAVASIMSVWLIRKVFRYQIRKDNYLLDKNPERMPPLPKIDDWTKALTVAVIILSGLILLVSIRLVLSISAFIQHL